jgi:hypothetical protein
MPVFVASAYCASDDALSISVYQGPNHLRITASPPVLRQRRTASASACRPKRVSLCMRWKAPVSTTRLLGKASWVRSSRFYNIPNALPMTGCPFCESATVGQVRCP